MYGIVSPTRLFLQILCPGHDVKLYPHRVMSIVQGMMLNCIHIFIVTGSFLYWCVIKLASQRFFIHSCIYLRILIKCYLATVLGTNSLSVLMCRKAINQSINAADSTNILKSRRDIFWYNQDLKFDWIAEITGIGSCSLKFS